MPEQNISYFKLFYFCTYFYFVKGIRKNAFGIVWVDRGVGMFGRFSSIFEAGTAEQRG